MTSVQLAGIGRVLARVVCEGFQAYDAVIHLSGAGETDRHGHDVTEASLQLDGYPAGVLALHHERPLTAAQRQLLTDVAVQVGRLLSGDHPADDRFYTLMARASRAACA
ncbi:hypothetical protein [Actinoplanes philippinensis]|uniref:hypothetical protein n=1 Tax=Actinoplanes philippinensis TaxID=35752 RepID=UPI0033CFF6B6